MCSHLITGWLTKEWYCSFFLFFFDNCYLSTPGVSKEVKSYERKLFVTADSPLKLFGFFRSISYFVTFWHFFSAAWYWLIIWRSRWGNHLACKRFFLLLLLLLLFLFQIRFYFWCVSWFFCFFFCILSFFIIFSFSIFRSWENGKYDYMLWQLNNFLNISKIFS